MTDILQQLQALVTKTTAFNSTGVDLITGTPRRGLKARVIVTNCSGATAGGIFTPAIEHSTDNTTFTRLSTGDPLTTTTAGFSSEVYIPFETSKRYVRAALDQPNTTGTPTISYQVDLCLTRPG